MSYIDWKIANETKRGNNANFSKDGKLFYRDGTGDKKTCSYNLTFYKGNVHDDIIASEIICVGSDGDSIYLTTKEKPNVPKFSINAPSNNEGRAYKVNGKDLVTKIVNTLTGINPKGDLDANFNLKLVGENVYKIVDFKVR